MTKKNKNNYLPIVVAATSLGLAWYFRKDILSFLGIEKNNASSEDEIYETNIDNVLAVPRPASNVANVPTPQTSQTTQTILSPLGTPKDQLKFDVNLVLGNRGQEVAKVQQILNRISKIYGTQNIAEDGIFGVGTQSKLINIFGKSSITVRQAYYLLFAIWNATQNNEQKKWFDKYYKYYLTQPDRLNSARTKYFQNNPLI